MTDYTKASGTGTIMIRDTGTTVEFWFKAGYSSDFYSGLSFNWTANGTTTPKSINYPTGAAWYKVGSVTVTTAQTVTFKLLTATGISGMGGPTTLTASIVRSGVPVAPAVPTLSNVTISSVTVTWSAVSGATGYQIGYGTSADAPTTMIDATSPHVVTNLTPGTKTYFWVRAKNATGWGAWSPSANATTLLAAYVRVNSVWKLAVPYVRVAGVWVQAQPIPLQNLVTGGGHPPTLPTP